MSYFGNQTFPQQPWQAQTQHPPPIGVFNQEQAWPTGNHGQFNNFQNRSYSFPRYVPDVSEVPQPQQTDFERTYVLPRAVGRMPLQPLQPLVPFSQWNEGFIANEYTTRFHYTNSYPAPQQPEYYGPPQENYERLHLHAPLQYSASPQNRGRPYQRGQSQRRGYTQHRGQLQTRGTAYHRGYTRLFRPPSLHLNVVPHPQVLPDPERTLTPQDAQPKEESNKERVQQVHAWRNRSECPRPSGRYIPLPPPPVDLDMVAEVGDIVCVKPWDDQLTWIEGCVVKADFSVIKDHKPSPRYLVSYINPQSKREVRRVFRPAMFEIRVRAPDIIGAEPLPAGIDRDVYACIPPLITKSGEPIEKIWTHAQVLTPPDEHGRIKIRILVGPSKNVLFDNFSTKATLPFTKLSRVRVAKLGYAVA
ncbi:hypothetical protein B0H11DRAFT_1900426 [Mycena galericulata]|nr:hypothetical protein B0H11DRAFT_1900426 [Mycena galericulata]